MVSALVDRITFRSHVLNMNGDSYRKDNIKYYDKSRETKVYSRFSLLLYTKWLRNSLAQEPKWYTFSLAQVAQKFISTWLKNSLTFTGNKRI